MLLCCFPVKDFCPGLYITHYYLCSIANTYENDNIQDTLTHWDGEPPTAGKDTLGRWNQSTKPRVLSHAVQRWVLPCPYALSHAGWCFLSCRLRTDVMPHAYLRLSQLPCGPKCQSHHKRSLLQHKCWCSVVVFPLTGVQTKQMTRGLKISRLVCGITLIHLPAKESLPCDMKYFDIIAIQFNKINYIHQPLASQVHPWWLTMNFGKTHDRAGAFLPNSHESNKYNNRIYY